MQFQEISLEDILIENSTYSNTSGLKKKLFKRNLLRNECYICGLSEWFGKPITLQIDHINGIRNDHRLENLRILCPNCHTQTENYGSKNKAYNQKERIRKTCDCGKVIYKSAKRCQSCANKNREKLFWPSTEELLRRVEESSFVAVAKELGVSDNAIRKRINKHC